MNKKILLIDDDPDMIDMYQPYLQQNGYDVKAAYNTTEAKEIFPEFNPDVVFCDLVMEHFDSGFVLCHWMARQPGRNKRWVVIFTSTGHETGYRFSTQTREEKSWINADDYLDKPIAPRDLLQYVEEKVLPALAEKNK